jgi:hypothetical protein
VAPHEKVWELLLQDNRVLKEYNTEMLQKIEKGNHENGSLLHEATSDSLFPNFYLGEYKTPKLFNGSD